VFLSCRPFIVNATFVTGLVGVGETTGKKHTIVRRDDGGKIITNFN
jgi:hypothetical protein